MNAARETISDKRCSTSAPRAFCFPTNAVAKVYFQPELEYDARVTVTANGLQSVHSCKMKWQLCDGTLDTMIGPCPWAHSVGGFMGDSAADQVCGAFIVSDPLSVHPTSFDFAFGDLDDGKRADAKNCVRVEINVSKQVTAVYDGVGIIVQHSSIGTFDEILCDRGLCLRSLSSRRYLVMKRFLY